MEEDEGEVEEKAGEHEEEGVEELDLRRLHDRGHHQVDSDAQHHDGDDYWHLQNSELKCHTREVSRLWSSARRCRTTEGQNIQLLWKRTDFHFTVGKCLVSDKNSAC